MHQPNSKRSERDAQENYFKGFWFFFMGRIAAQVMKPWSQTIMKKVLVINLLTFSVFVSFQVFYRVLSLSLKANFSKSQLDQGWKGKWYYYSKFRYNTYIFYWFGIND